MELKQYAHAIWISGSIQEFKVFTTLRPQPLTAAHPFCTPLSCQDESGPAHLDIHTVHSGWNTLLPTVTSFLFELNLLPHPAPAHPAHNTPSPATSTGNFCNHQTAEGQASGNSKCYCVEELNMTAQAHSFIPLRKYF